jgi:hypothetical protein
VKEGFYRALMASLKAGRGTEEGENGRGGRWRRGRWKGRGSWRWKTSPIGGPHLSARGRERGEEAGAGEPLGR